MRVCLRADADTQLGLGHLRRCLSLAGALRRCGAEATIAVRDSDVDVSALVGSEDFPLLRLDASTDAGSDADAVLAALGGLQLDWVVVDHYRLDARWHERVRAATGARIAVIDDLADRALSPDALIDHNLVPDAGGHRARYARHLLRRPNLWACGPRFALLGPAYDRQDPDFELRDQVASIGIFMGGTDPARMSVPLLEAVRKEAGFPGLVEVASTSSNPSLAALRAAVARDGNATLALDLPDLRDFYARHDLQVGAGGGAAWERCAVGVPTLTLAVAANQQAVIPALVAAGATITSLDNDMCSVGGALRRLIGSADLRRTLSQHSRALVDGRGALRCALALAAAFPQSVALRPAAEADSRLLWRWRNHPATRAMSRNADEIPWPAHQEWIVRRLAAADPRLWVGMVGAVEVGVIRFDRLADGALEVSLYLDPGLQGLGLGHELLAAGERAVTGPESKRIHAEVLAANPASARLFATAGYCGTGELCFEKLLPATVQATAEEIRP